MLDAMRLLKDPEEQNVMRRAAAISSAAHVRAMRATHPGLHEYAIEAELLYEFRRNGAQFPAYTSIVAGGANACILHYSANDAQLKDGDLLSAMEGAGKLIDDDELRDAMAGKPPPCAAATRPPAATTMNCASRRRHRRATPSPPCPACAMLGNATSAAPPACASRARAMVCSAL